MRSFSFRLAFSAVAVLSFAVRGSAQSTATLTQTVGQRPTIGVLSATPTSGYTAGAPVTFSYILHTAGAPAPTTESVQFLDGTTVIGSQVIGSVAGSNLLPYSQISLANGWSQTGTAANLNPASFAGPDGSANTATLASFPDTTSGTSGIQFSVPGTSYANQPMTFSVWARAAAATTLNLSLSDSQSVSASGSSTCALTTAWQRCVLTYSFPANAGSGFSAAVSVSGTVAQAVSLWGAQVEKASAAGPYVSTIGTARGSSAYGGSVTFPYSMFQAGSHTISVLYGGDNNLLASTSNALALSLTKATPTISLASNPSSAAVYGEPVSLTATLSGTPGNPADLPTGTVQFFDGTTSLGTATVSSGVASLTLTGPTTLPSGSHTITAVFAGSSDFNAVTSSATTLTVTKASNAVAITVASSLNPSTYGDSVVFRVVVTSLAGAAIPTGSVVVSDGATNLGTITLDGTGAGTLTVPLLTAGTHSLVATYSGDGNYN